MSASSPASPPEQHKALIRLRGQALALLDRSDLNALVIDVKGDTGIVPFRSAAYAQAGLGPQAPITVSDMPALLAQLEAMLAQDRRHGADRLVAVYSEAAGWSFGCWRNWE